MSWAPVLQGAARDRALAAAVAIGEALERRDPVWSPDERGDGGGARDASLAGGAAGVALLFAYLDAASLGKGRDDLALAFLDAAIDGVASTPMDASLYGGFTGVAWTATHLIGRILDDSDDPAEEIDAEVRDLVGRSPWTDEYDLVSGLVGFGAYALERLPRPHAAECLAAIVDRLAELARPADGGLTWQTPPDLLPAYQREMCPDGYANLGLAHGVPGVVALLGRVSAAGVAGSKARGLLDGAVTWLLRQKRSGGGSRFSSWVVPGVEPTDCRSAWCYGDPGVAAALLVAARSVREGAWEREALDIALHAARRPPETAGVVDAGLCHGAAGLGHVFNRIYRATGNEELRAAAASWLEKALEMRRPDSGIAGFTSLWIDDKKERRAWADPALLTGAAGVALALLAGATAVEPGWDRMLLVSMPPSRTDDSGSE